MVVAPTAVILLGVSVDASPVLRTEIQSSISKTSGSAAPAGAVKVMPLNCNPAASTAAVPAARVLRARNLSAAVSWLNAM